MGVGRTGCAFVLAVLKLAVLCTQFGNSPLSAIPGAPHEEPVQLLTTKADRQSHGQSQSSNCSVPGNLADRTQSQPSKLTSQTYVTNLRHKPSHKFVSGRARQNNWITFSAHTVCVLGLWLDNGSKHVAICTLLQSISCVPTQSVTQSHSKMAPLTTVSTSQQ
jgi:hypothetical protein